MAGRVLRGSERSLLFFDPIVEEQKGAVIMSAAATMSVVMTMKAKTITWRRFMWSQIQ